MMSIINKKLSTRYFLYKNFINLHKNNNSFYYFCIGGVILQIHGEFDMILSIMHTYTPHFWFHRGDICIMYA